MAARDGRGYAMPTRVVAPDDPLFVIASGASSPNVPLRLVVRDDWFALAVYVGGNTTVFANDDTGWRGRPSGSGGGGLELPELPLRIGLGGSWSTPISQPSAYAAVTIEGRVRREIERVDIEFDDGHVEHPPVRSGAFAWFYACRPAPLRPPRDIWREILGAFPPRAR